MFGQQRNDFFAIFRLFFSKGTVGIFKHDYDRFIFKSFRSDMREYTKFVGVEIKKQNKKLSWRKQMKLEYLL